MGTVIDFMPFLEKRKASQLSPEDFNIYYDTDEDVWIASANGETIYSSESYNVILESAGWTVYDDLGDYPDEDDTFDYEEM